MSFLPPRMQRDYFDHNSTSPLRPEVAEALKSWVSDPFANPSSVHSSGRRSRKAIDDARENVARFLGCTPSEIIFTSGGTEANHLAWSHFQRKDARILTTEIEHSSVMAAASRAKAQGAAVEYLKADRDGKLCLYREAVFSQDLGPDLISVQSANNETGVIHELHEISELRKAQTVFHTDAVQLLGKDRIDLREMNLDALSLSGHKLGALQGIGALYLRRGAPIEPIWLGGHQERERRTGTENVLGALSLGVACESLLKDGGREMVRIQSLRDQFETAVRTQIPEAEITGFNCRRLPNTSHVRFPDTDGESLMIALDLAGFDTSTGAACSSGTLEPSHVLLAMGLSASEASGSIRFSFGWNTSKSGIERLIEVLPTLVAQVRSGKNLRQNQIRETA